MLGSPIYRVPRVAPTLHDGHNQHPIGGGTIVSYRFDGTRFAVILSAAKNPCVAMRDSSLRSE